MEKEFIPYTLSLELKELGFDEECFGYYVSEESQTLEIELVKQENLLRDAIAAPLYQQAFRWFREKYNLDSYLKPEIIKGKKSYDFYIWIDNNEDLEIGMYNLTTYEEAELECLKKLIEIVKNK
jgi:hypothetical protein